MNHSVLTSEYSVYKTTCPGSIYVAIPQAFARFVRECLMEYQSLLSVPADKRVKGIILNSPEGIGSGHLQNIDIPINQLRFDS